MRPDLSLLFDRPFWLDEWHAVLPASRPSLGVLFGDLQQGSDFAPPLLHVSLWLLRIVTGGELTPTAARLFSLLCVVGALAFVYLALRRRHDVVPSSAGAIACAMHAIVVAYTFEARFYAPWLLFAAMFAWSLRIDAERERSTRRSASIGLASVLLCEVHWLGVVSLGLMCAGALVGARLWWRAELKRMLPASAGLVALAVSLPLLVGQRSSISEATWIAELSWRQFRDLTLAYWGGVPVLLALAAVAGGLVLRRGYGKQLQVSMSTALRDPGLMAMVALAAMPIVLAMISLRQPAMLPRYAIVGVLAWAPLVAFAVQLLGPAARVVASAILTLGVLAQLGGQVGLQRQIRDVVVRDGQLLRDACASAQGVAFVTRVQMYYYTNELRSGCPQAAYLVLPPEALERLFSGPNAPVRRQYRTEAEFALLHQRLYGFPRTITPAQLDSLPHFVVMVESWNLPKDATGREILSPVLFPRHRAISMTGNGIAYIREAPSGTP